MNELNKVQIIALLSLVIGQLNDLGEKSLEERQINRIGDVMSELFETLGPQGYGDATVEGLQNIAKQLYAALEVKR